METISDNSLEPAFSRNNIPVVFATDEKFVLYSAVAIKSIIDNSSKSRNYDIIILEEKLSVADKEQLLSVIKKEENFSLRFVNMTSWIEKQGRDLFYLHSHFSVATYYRLFICDILKKYEKIIYLDGDIVVLADLADLFQIDLGTHYLGATRDLAYNFFDKDYVLSVLGMSEVEDYFQAGVLLLSLQNMRKDHLSESFLHCLKRIKQPQTVDQDILNSVCNERIFFLPQEWNYQWNLRELLKENASKRPEIYKAYQDAEKNMRIIHYASMVKPWNSPEEKYADLWWKYAKKTSFYDQIHSNSYFEQIIFLKQQNQKLSMELQQVLHSIPWRITWPLRWLYDFLKYEVPRFFHRKKRNRGRG